MVRIVSMSCARCETYFGDWRSHGPFFPDEDWEILTSEEFPLGTHGGDTGRSGVARCRACGGEASFDCSYGPGYWFRAKSG